MDTEGKRKKNSQRKSNLKTDINYKKIKNYKETNRKGAGTNVKWTHKERERKCKLAS